MTQQSNRYTITNRYLFKGSLVMQTALHIGGGRVTLSSSNSPIMLTPEEVPFIPGSSFKGSLRSTVEKFVPQLPSGLFSCALIELNEEEAAEERRLGRRVCSTARQGEIAKERRNSRGREDEVMRKARENLCDTCRLFGSPFEAARISINDLYMPEEAWNGVLQVRDGVAIDRDSEKAKDRLKYDFEVVPASATFNLEIVLENATAQDLQLVSVGLSEFVHGFAPIGGKRSRGLGVCRLENLHVSELDLTDEKTRAARLKDYLLEQKFSHNEDGKTFLSTHISHLFTNASK
jgi:CRISPR-associated RAMP protein (TIGR02581 family)